EDFTRSCSAVQTSGEAYRSPSSHMEAGSTGATTTGAGSLAGGFASATTPADAPRRSASAIIFVAFMIVPVPWRIFPSILRDPGQQSTRSREVLRGDPRLLGWPDLRSIIDVRQPILRVLDHTVRGAALRPHSGRAFPPGL